MRQLQGLGTHPAFSGPRALMRFDMLFHCFFLPVLLQDEREERGFPEIFFLRTIVNYPDDHSSPERVLETLQTERPGVVKRGVPLSKDCDKGCDAFFGRQFLCRLRHVVSGEYCLRRERPPRCCAIGWKASTTRSLQEFEDVLKDKGKGVSPPKKIVFTERLPSLQNRRWNDIQG